MNEQCRRCKRYGHFKIMCGNTARHVDEIDSESDEADEVYFLDTVEKEVRGSNKPWTVTLQIKDTPIRFKIDTGADISIMSDKTFRSLKRKPKLTTCKQILSSPGGRLTARGQFYAQTGYNGGEYKFRVVVVANRVSTLLSRTVARKMGLVTRTLSIQTRPNAQDDSEHLKPTDLPDRQWPGKKLYNEWSAGVWVARRSLAFFFLSQ